MWFSSKSPKQKSQRKETSRFLRKGLSRRYEARSVTVKSEGSRIPFSVIVLWSLVLITLFYLAFFSIFFRIGEPRLVGMDKVPREAVREFVEREITGTYLGIFPKRDFFLVRPLRLEEQLRQEYPLFAAVRVTRIFPDDISIDVTERKKNILWCAGESCYLIDEKGEAMENERALLPENIAHSLFVTDTSGKAVTAGERVFDPSYGAFVIRLNESFSTELNITLDPHMTTVSRFANEVRVKTNEGWEAYVSTDVPLESSVNALRLLFEKKLPGEMRAKLAYIDLRAENRVYYALRESERPEGENTDAATTSVSPEEQKIDSESKKKKK
jgi:cell division septal protein FtsQ